MVRFWICRKWLFGPSPRLIDVPFDTTELKIISSSSDYAVAIVRANNAVINMQRKISIHHWMSTVLFYRVDSKWFTNYGFGEITSESYTNVLEEGTFGQMDVFDTDRWKLSLSNYPQGQTAVLPLGWQSHRILTVT